MRDSEKIQIYRSIFRGRDDAYGSGSGCCNEAELTDDILMGHFRGEERLVR